MVRSTHCASEQLSTGNSAYRAFVLEWLDRLLRADVGGGDVTSRTLFQSDHISEAVVVAKEPGIAAGMEELEIFLAMKGVHFEKNISDGEKFQAGTRLVKLNGNTIQILELERTILNFLQRMCGIATLTAQFVEKVPKDVLVCSTRKVLWGLLDKKACVAGGGGTHRLRLDDGVLIKDNHLEALGSDPLQALERFSKTKAKFLEMEIDHVEKVLPLAEKIHEFIGKHPKLPPFFIMFDNVPPEQIRSAIAELSQLRDKLFFEASGGITKENISEYGKTGVNVISSGALTHSARALDLSLEIGA